MTIGLLEDMQNIASHHGGYDAFVPWLGSATQHAWFEIEKMWKGKHNLANVLRAENSQRKDQGAK